MCQDSEEAQRILDKFKERYNSDIEVLTLMHATRNKTSSLHRAFLLQALQDRKLREKIARLLEHFKEDCKHKVENRQLHWEEFQECMIINTVNLEISYTKCMTRY